MRFTLRYIVYRGFQDDFKAEANFGSYAEAVAFVDAKGWDFDDQNPITPSVWIRSQVCEVRD